MALSPTADLLAAQACKKGKNSGSLILLRRIEEKRSAESHRRRNIVRRKDWSVSFEENASIDMTSRKKSTKDYLKEEERRVKEGKCSKLKDKKRK